MLLICKERLQQRVFGLPLLNDAILLDFIVRRSEAARQLVAEVEVAWGVVLQEVLVLARLRVLVRLG
jgi:hypothetical protein